ncbi:MAG: TetR/AcrR family transcriptional regulator [Pseudonocardiaceae bacterium]
MPNAGEGAGERATKSQRTREFIVESALQLFRERGYERTTMRAIAEAAGVSVGNAYYYFRSKEELVQGFYDQLAADHAAAAAEPLAASTDLGERLRAALLTWLAVAEPYHSLAGRFFAVAAQPGNPLSPFSHASHAARDAEIALYHEVIAGSSVRVAEELAPDLPELFWLYHLGIVLFWVHDDSVDLRRTRALIERTVSMIERLCRLSRFRVLGPVVRQVPRLLAELRDGE